LEVTCGTSIPHWPDVHIPTCSFITILINDQLMHITHVLNVGEYNNNLNKFGRILDHWSMIFVYVFICKVSLFIGKFIPFSEGKQTTLQNVYAKIILNG
jgi:hypothetical protein